MTLQVEYHATNGSAVATTENAADLHELRDNHPEFHEGAMVVVTYPSAPPVAFFGREKPILFEGVEARPGDTILRGSDGRFWVTSTTDTLASTTLGQPAE